MRSEYKFPTKLDMGLLVVSGAILLGVFRPITPESQGTQISVPSTPTPEATREVYPTMVPINELPFATRRWCSDITVDGKRECK